jgi:hypothetical protein
MWSDEARAAAAEARKRKTHGNTHEGKNGNRKIAKKAKNDHKSVSGGIIKGAGAGAVVGAAIGAAALHQYGGARIGAKLGAIAGAKTGAVAGGIYRYATKKRGK